MSNEIGELKEAVGNLKSRLESLPDTETVRRLISESKGQSEDEKDLERYSAHAALLTQATAFLTQITASVTIYITITGATWIIASSNSFGATVETLAALLVFHILLSVGFALAIWGIGNNFIQRLNLARWLGEAFWPKIEKMGGFEFSWKGIPQVIPQPPTPPGGASGGMSTKGGVVQEYPEIQISKEGQASPTLRRKEYSEWKGGRNNKGSLLGFNLRYRAFNFPSLRFQRFWVALPIFGIFISGWLLNELDNQRRARTVVCRYAASVLFSPPGKEPTSQLLERARYLFDKANCHLTWEDVVRMRG